MTRPLTVVSSHPRLSAIGHLHLAKLLSTSLGSLWASLFSWPRGIADCRFQIQLAFLLAARCSLTTGNPPPLGSLRQFEGLPSGIAQQLPFANVSHVSPFAPELHDPVAFACQRGPA